MADSPRYLIDSNVLIEAHRVYYSFDICPGFWESLVWVHEQDKMLSLDKVRDEITQETDVLANWAKSVMPSSAFAGSDDADTVKWFGDMQVWAQEQEQFTDAAKEEFASVADAWLIAHAKAKGLILVTHEKYKKDIKKKIPMPNVCEAFDVQHVNTFEMLRALAIQYNWETT